METHGTTGAPSRAVGRVVGLVALAVLLLVDLAHGVGLNATLVLVILSVWVIAGHHTERQPRATGAVLVTASLVATALALTETRTIIFSGTEVAALLCTAAAALRWYRGPIDAVVAGACSLAAVGVALRAGDDLALTVGVVVVLALLAVGFALVRRAATGAPATAAATPAAAPVESTAPAEPVEAEPVEPAPPPSPPVAAAPQDLEATQVQPVVAVDRDPEHAVGNPFVTIRARAAELTRSGVQVRIELDPPNPPAIDWTPQLSAAVVAIVQEALTNVRLHAVGAATVQLHFHLGEDHLDLRIVDDGHGLPPSRPAGGLLQMQRQAAKVAGKVRAGPSPHGGWEVRAVLPALRRTAPTQA